MTKSTSKVLASVLIGASLLFAAPALSLAANGDCGQPASSGAKPAVSDALAVLRKAVSVPGANPCDAKACICDVNSVGGITVADALLTLRAAVVVPAPALNCTCASGAPACTSAEFLTRSGSDLDSGWTGLAHNSEIAVGASLRFRTLRRCTTTPASDSGAPCEKNSDCPGQTCKPTCDCNNDTSCEITGPTNPKHCLATLAVCKTNADCGCATNGDCGESACVSYFGPPLPLYSGNVPVCILTYFDSPLTGTANSANGTAVTSASLRSRIFLGTTINVPSTNYPLPCPRCGAPNQHPKVGDKQFFCEKGATPGAACTVDSVSPFWGGTSFDCLPDHYASTIAIHFSEVTTGTVSVTAKLPCMGNGFKNNPLVPNSNPKCTDHNSAADPVCLTNAECMRCTNDPTIKCTALTGAADCAGNGTCAEAPDQPVTCGYWCSCGFCTDSTGFQYDGNQPCFQDSDCSPNDHCKVGTGTSNAAWSPQLQPNQCSGATEKYICGLFDKELCSASKKGHCTLGTYRWCINDAGCSSAGLGTCDLVTERKACFEPRITRTGSPSPLGHYCSAGEPKPCTTNADCPRCSGDNNKTCATNTDCSAKGVGTCGQAECTGDSSGPKTVALFCVPQTSDSGVNTAGGITGPGAVTLNGYIKVCRCGDGVIGCDEQCDDHNTINGDGCSDLCQTE